MKIKVELLNGNEHRNQNTGHNPSVSHIFDGETAVKDHIKVLCSHFKIPLDKSSCYSLQNPSTQQFIEDSYFTPERLSEAEKSYFILRMKPYAIANRVVESLKSNPSNSHLVKDIMFNIRFQLKDVEYVEEFIEKGGINHLLDVIVNSSGNTQSYALTALRCFMGYNSGLDEVMTRPQLIDKLYSLVNSSVLPSVCRQAIELLFVVCNFDGFQLIHRAAKNYAIETTTMAYSNIVSLLASGDMETQINALTLFNCLLDSAPNPRKVEKLLSRWKALGIIKILQSQEHVTHSDFKTQLARFQSFCGLGSDANGRKRGLTHQGSQQELEMLLLHYREQQPLISLLSSELKYLRNAIKSAIENGSYINYRAPTERYDEYQCRKNEMIADQPVNINFIKRNDKFTNAFRKSMYLRSPNTSVLFDQSTMDDSDDELLNQSGSGTPSTSSPIPSKENGLHIHHRISQSKSLFIIKKQSSNGHLPNDISNLSPISSDKTQSQPHTKLNLSPISSIDDPSSVVSSSTTTPIINNQSTVTVTSPPQQSNTSNPNNTTSNLPHTIQLTNFLPSPIKPKTLPTKHAITPPKRMKPLHWCRILNSNHSGKKKTIWEQIQELKFDEEQFVELFSLYTEKVVTYNGSPVVAHLNHGSGSKIMSSKPTQKVISVLSQKRSNSISLMCSKLPSEENLIRYIREMDSNKLSLEQISAIIVNLPTFEEISAIQELHSDEVVLDKAERWCLMIDGFPKIKSRLRCWEFMIKFDDQIKSINESIEVIAQACKELQSSLSLQYLFACLLSLGNFMNGGHQYRGQSDGFALEAIYKIIELKDNNNSGSLLDFAAKTIQNQYSKFNNLVMELPHIPQASLINLTEIGNQLSKLITDFTEIQSLTEEIIQSTDSEDPFITIIPKANNSIQVQLKSTQKLFNCTEILFFDTIEFFIPSNVDIISSNGSSLNLNNHSNNNNVKYTTEKFFTLFSTIITSVKKSPSKRLSQKGFGLKISNSDDPMAVIIECLKSGSPFKVLDIKTNLPPESTTN